MSPEISRLVARYFYVKQTPITRQSEILPYVEKAKTLDDFPEPWRTKLRLFQNEQANNKEN